MSRLENVALVGPGSLATRKLEASAFERRTRLAVIVTALLSLLSTNVSAQDDKPSTPLEAPFAVPDSGTGTGTGTVAAVANVIVTAPATPVGTLASLGLNFQGSQLFVDSFFIPPDTMGAVGPDHIVQMYGADSKNKTKAFKPEPNNV